MKLDWILIFPVLAFINSIPALNCRSLNKLRKSLDRLNHLTPPSSNNKFQQKSQRNQQNDPMQGFPLMPRTGIKAAKASKPRKSQEKNKMCGNKPCDALPTAKRLYEDLIIDPAYNPAVRPVRKYGENVTVQMGVALAEIEDLEERAGRLAFRFQFRFLWNDYQLSWDPSEYGGIREIDMTPDQIWTPDIDLYNNVESVVKKDIKARLYSNGDILWMPTGHFKSSCSHNIRTDTWRCPLLFRSWIHTASEMDIMPYQGEVAMDLEEMRHNPHWVVLETNGEKIMERFSCCGDALFPGMKYQLTVRNKIGHPALLGKRSIRTLEF